MTKTKEGRHSWYELTEMVRYLVQNCATKDDLAGYATKEDFAGLATKEDLKNFVTKEDIKGFVSKDDLRSELAQVKQELRDHTTRECAKVRGDLIAVSHRQEEKTNEIIKSMQKHQVLPNNEAVRLMRINPFVQPVD